MKPLWWHLVSGNVEGQSGIFTPTEAEEGQMLSSNAMQLDHCQRPDVTYLLHHQAAHTLANK